jgi:hypothetical protein
MTTVALMVTHVFWRCNQELLLTRLYAYSALKKQTYVGDVKLR